MKLEEIEKEMLEGNIVPARLGELRVQLGAKYSFAMGQYEKILMEKPAIWNQMRPSFKSDTACERAWSSTPKGMDEIHWKLNLKKIEKMMSALKMQWEIVNAEARNLM